MRETNLNKSIKRTDIKVGDTIAVTRKVTVKAVRETNLYAGRDAGHKPVTIVATDADTLVVTDTESVTLVERDKDPLLSIPAEAIIVTWRDADGYDHIARRGSATEAWVTSHFGPDATYTSSELAKAIEDGELDGYKEGSFEVLKSKSKFSTGGYVNGARVSQSSIDTVNRIASQRVVSGRSPITGYPLVP